MMQLKKNQIRDNSNDKVDVLKDFTYFLEIFITLSFISPAKTQIFTISDAKKCVRISIDKKSKIY